MKTKKNIFRYFTLIVFAGFSLTSCDLDLLPLNSVVLENYWTNKDDVERSLTACYVGMQEGGWVQKAIIWGEVRSDNIAVREGTSASGNVTPQYLQNIIKGNLKQNNAACSWGAHYRVINLCNVLLYYAPQVAEKDPNITPSILAETIAQAKAIRALNYFYLVRTFKDIPFTLEPSIDDTQDYMLPATKGEEVLDALIADLESCKDDARIKYASYMYNYGKITRKAIYTLLADMYLWKASNANLDAVTQMENYKKCVECCDYVLQQKIDEYVADADGLRLQQQCDPDIYRTYGYPLLREDYNSGMLSTMAWASSLNFNASTSFESIFELYYGLEDKDLKNTDVSYMYNGADPDKNRIAYLGASTKLMESKPTSGTFTNSESTLFTTYNDYRTVTGFIYDQSATSFYEICKYVTTPSGFQLGSTWSNGYGTGTTTFRPYLSSYEPWVIYRLSDVLLMRAEAEIEIGHIMDPTWDATVTPTPAKPRKAPKGATLSTADEYFRDAFNLISAVYIRSNPAAKTSPISAPSLSGSNAVKDYENMVILLENERHREFLFEGKRYYDLVRRARRDGNTSHINKALQAKFDEAPRAFIIKMAQMDFMYMPYAESELKANPNLQQNPVYAEEEKNSKN